MKTTIKLLAALAFFAQPTLQAQTGNNESKFGIKGGVNFSNLYTKDVDDQNVLTGYTIGVFTQVPLTNWVSFQPELLYTTKGAELEYDNAFVEGTGKFRLNYIEVPVLLKINLTDHFNIHAGPYAAFLVNSKITNEDANGNINFEDEVDSNDLNKFDYGLAAGLGFDFDNFGIGARYNYGLSTVGKERSFAGTTYTFPDSKNSALSIYATIKF
jgi:hypothetical protein